MHVADVLYCTLEGLSSLQESFNSQAQSRVVHVLWALIGCQGNIIGECLAHYVVKAFKPRPRVLQIPPKLGVAACIGSDYR